MSSYERIQNNLWNIWVDHEAYPMNHETSIFRQEFDDSGKVSPFSFILDTEDIVDE